MGAGRGRRGGSDLRRRASSENDGCGCAAVATSPCVSGSFSSACAAPRDSLDGCAARRRRRVVLHRPEPGHGRDLPDLHRRRAVRPRPPARDPAALPSAAASQSLTVHSRRASPPPARRREAPAPHTLARPRGTSAHACGDPPLGPRARAARRAAARRAGLSAGKQSCDRCADTPRAFPRGRARARARGTPALRARDGRKRFCHLAGWVRRRQRPCAWGQGACVRRAAQRVSAKSRLLSPGRWVPGARARACGPRSPCAPLTLSPRGVFSRSRDVRPPPRARNATAAARARARPATSRRAAPRSRRARAAGTPPGRDGLLRMHAFPSLPRLADGFCGSCPPACVEDCAGDR